MGDSGTRRRLCDSRKGACYRIGHTREISVSCVLDRSKNEDERDCLGIVNHNDSVDRLEVRMRGDYTA